MLTVTIPGLRLVSEANAHEHWRKRSARAKHQHRVVAAFLGPQSRVPAPHPVPLVVTITRVGARQMDSDNVVGSAKHVRDAVAAWLGRDDGPTCGVEWRVEQRKGPYAVEVRIEAVQRVGDGAGLTRDPDPGDQKRGGNATGCASEASAPEVGGRRNTAGKAGACQVGIASAGGRAR